MPLSNKARNSIEAAIKRFIAYLRFVSIGPQALTKPEITDLIRNGIITQKSFKAAVMTAYMKTHKIAAGKSGNVAPKAMRDGALEYLERMFQSYSVKAGQDLKTDLMASVESHLMPLFDRREGQQIFEVLKDKDRYSKNLASALHGKVDNWRHRWRTIVTTELNRASNWGSMDAIIHNNPTKQPQEIIVYKLGPNDDATCKHCKEFWFVGASNIPKVYKLSELIANGSNIGKKARDWKPTVDSTHPNERHILHELRPGYGFSGTGEIKYIGEGHDEYAMQRGLQKTEESLEKGVVRDIATAAALTAATVVPKAVAVPSYSQSGIFAAAPVSGDLEGDLRHIAQIESSDGKNKNHPRVNYGLNAGQKAAGSTGLMPITIKETIQNNPILKSKFGYVSNMKPDEITEHLNKNPHIEAEIASHHWRRLDRIFKKNDARKAYAWNQGITAALKATEQEVMAHPYVQKFLKFKRGPK